MPEKRSPESIIQLAQEARREGKKAPIDLPDADLSGLQLPAGDLVGANLEGADLTGAILAGAFLKRANLKNAILVGASLDGADFTDADLRGADLAGARIDDAVLANARLDGACFQLVLGDPLSMNGATMDRVTIERSEFTMRDIAQMVVRGVYVDEHDEVPISMRRAPAGGDLEDPSSWSDDATEAQPSSSLDAGSEPPSGLPLVIPPEARLPQIALPSSSSGESAPPSSGASSSVRFDAALDFDKPLSSLTDVKRALASLPPSAPRGAPISIRGAGIPSSQAPLSLSPSSRGASIIPSFRVAEISTRISQVEQDQEMPVSQRMFQQLNLLIDNARFEAAPVSLRPALPAVREMTAGDFAFPMPGDEYLGVMIDEELPRGTTSRCFSGKTADGQAVIVRMFDPHCEGAALQLPAFQRGLRALNKLQVLDEYDLSVVELIAVSSDQTAYVVKKYPGQSLKEMVEVSMTLKAGLEAICSLARTMSAIHRHGVMVRSWKPSNVLVDGFSLLLSEPDMVHLSTLAQYRGDAGGYRAYAAPEELLGRGTRSPTADVYSLGKMLEFLLTGEEPLVPLGSPPLIAQRESVPQVLVEIVRRATAQEPADRYQQVDDLLSDLVAFQQGGEKAVLMASLRPAVVSQLSVPPMSTRPGMPDIDALIREKLKARKKVDEGPAPLSKARTTEIGAAVLGGVGGLAIIVVLFLSPRSVDTMETMALVIAGLMGLTALLLPVPSFKRVPYRIATCLAAAALIWMIDPLGLARFTWGRQLGSGTTAQKQAALESLSRVGKRNATEAELDGGQFVDMDLANMNFSRSSLKNANFTRAFLVEAQFDLADVSGAKFNGANLFEANLERAVGLEQAECDRYTNLPEGFSCRKGFISRDGPDVEDSAAASQREKAQPQPEKKRRTSGSAVVLPGKAP